MALHDDDSARRKPGVTSVLALSLLLAGGCTGPSSQEPSPSPQEPPQNQNPPVLPGGNATEAAHVGEEFVCDPAAASPGPNLVRRLTTTEYLNTVSASLGLDLTAIASSRLPAETQGSGFDNDATSLIATFERVEAYEALAEEMAGQIPDAFISTLAACSDMTSACQQTLIDGLGRLLYRGPVQAAESQALLALYAAAATEAADFMESSRLVLRSMLQAPRFLYRVEGERGDGSVRPLSDFELASRLSYALWSSPPDEALRQAAESGGLQSAEALSAHVDRMLADPRAFTAATTFYDDWLDLRRLDTLTRSADSFPSFDNALLADMKAETLALFESVWQQGLPFASVYSAKSTRVSQALAMHYGFPAPQPGVQPYDLSANPTRAGLLTQGALLTLGGESASTVIRGLFALENLMCSEISAPPPGLDTTPPMLGPGASRRTVSEQRTSAPACGGCHNQMEPHVWGLVRFDASGAYSEVDEFGNFIQEDGRVLLPGEGAREYQTLVELAGIFAESPRIRDCLTLKLARYTLGRPTVKAEGCALSAARQTIAAGTGTYGDIVRSIAQTEMFRSIRTETE